MKALLLSSMLALVAGCSTVPERAPAAAGSTRPTAELGDEAARHALTMLGKPYRYGGASPSLGFDCSGLILYSYRQAGKSLPRSTDSQRAAARPIKVSQLRRGDLLFFNQEGKKYGHAAIYVGDGRFVHAPSSGKRVRADRLDNPYWKKHLSEARRL